MQNNKHAFGNCSGVALISFQQNLFPSYFVSLTVNTEQGAMALTLFMLIYEIHNNVNCIRTFAPHCASPTHPAPSAGRDGNGLLPSHTISLDRF